MNTLPETVLAVQSYVPDEIPVIKDSNFNLFLLDEEKIRQHEFNVSEIPTFKDSETAILRSPRLLHQTYGYLYDALQKKNIVLINTPEMVRRASEFEIHYPLIEEATPKSIIFSVHSSASDIFEEIKRKGLEAPLFMKTEVKSLKSGSVINNLDIESIETVVNNLRAQLSGFHTIIVREMVELRRLPDDPDTVLEYRAFVVNGEIATIENGTKGKNFPQCSEVGGLDFYNKWISKLHQLDFSNFYIMDIALLNDGSDFNIIEIKDGQYTKLKDINAFWHR